MSNVVKAAALATALAYTINPVSAQEVRKVVFGHTVPEQVIVIADDLRNSRSNPSVAFRVGLSQVFLTHEYDEKTDSWKYQAPPAQKKDQK